MEPRKCEDEEARRREAEDLISEAKKLSLDAFFQNVLGAKLTRNSPTGKSYNACPACGEHSQKSQCVSTRGDSTWRCWSCGKGGDILDAAMNVYGAKNVVLAARELTGRREGPRRHVKLPKANSAPKVQIDVKAVTEAMKKIGSLTRFDPLSPSCRYLMEVRKLPLWVLESARSRGLFGHLPEDPGEVTELVQKEIGKDLLVRAGFWNPEKKRPAFAYRPLVFFLPGRTSAEFRLGRDAVKDELKSIRLGPLTAPWWWVGNQPQAMQVEGFIDMLSAVALGWQGHIMAYPGVSNAVRHEWIEAAEGRYEVKRWVIAFDDDAGRVNKQGQSINPGQSAAAELVKFYTETQRSYKLAVPTEGDINEALKARFRAANAGMRSKATA